MKELATILKQGLSNVPGIQIKTNMQANLSAGVIKFQIRNRDTKTIYDRIWERHKIAMAITPAGDAEGLRFSPHIYNSEADLRRAIEAVKEAVT